MIERVLDKAIHLWPEIMDISRNILKGQEAVTWDKEITVAARKAVLKVIPAKKTLPEKTAKASTPLQPGIFQAWGDHAEDKDSHLLAKWLQQGAPLGFKQEIETTGTFPEVAGPQWHDEMLKELSRSVDGWSNYSSAEEEAEDLRDMLADYTQRGFCHIVDSYDSVLQELGEEPVLNKLGMVVKYKDGRKKSRIIWDMKESKANSVCSQGERIILPRLLDVAKAAVNIYKDGNTPWLAVVDVKDAFMNIPSGPDKFATAAAVPDPETGKMVYVVFDTLVFGCASSPTLWGRYAAWLGRTLAAIVPSASTQIYVDDPCYTLCGTLEEAALSLAKILLWMEITGYPIKLEKASGGKTVEWIGAVVQCDDANREVTVTVPEKKVQALLEVTEKMERRPVVTTKDLRAYAGQLSFVAGLVPHLRPFLSSIWAALSSVGSASDGARHSGKLVHTKRFGAALCWIEGLLKGGPGPLARTMSASVIHINAEIV